MMEYQYIKFYVTLFTYIEYVSKFNLVYLFLG